MITKLKAILLKQQSFIKLTPLIGVSLLLMLLIILSWSTTKTVEFTDESFYTIGYYFGIEADYSIIFFHKIYNLFFGFLSLNLVQNRLLGMLLMGISSLFLWHQSARYYFIKNKYNYLFVILTLGFLSYTFYPMAISYNLLSAIFIAIFIAFFFAYCNTGKLLYVFLLGFFSMLIVLNKFTNSVFLVYFFAGIIMFNKHIFFKTKRVITSLLFLYFLGNLIALFIFFPSLKIIIESYKNFLYGLSLSTAHGIKPMLIRLFDDSLFVLGYSVYLIPFLVVLLIKRINIHFIENHKTIIIVSFLIITYCLLSYKFSFFTSRYLIFVFYYLIICTIILVLIIYDSFKLKLLLISLFFIFIPFVASLGTNNSLFSQFTFYGSILAIGIYLLLREIPNKVIKNTLVIILILTATIQITYNKINTPYRSQNLQLQNTPVKNISYLKGIKVDEETNEIIKQVSRFKNHPSKKIFLCAHQLGLSIITNKKPLCYSWIDEANYHLIDKFLKNKEGELKENILFILPSSGENAIIAALLKVEDLEFKNNYKYTESITIKEDTLKIYERKRE